MENLIGDEKHLEQILENITVKQGYKGLDLGTGNGYIAFSLAKMNPNCDIVGLDIAVNTLDEFERLASTQGFELESCFMTEVIFQTNKTKEERFTKICTGMDKSIIAGYVKIVDGQE